MKYLVLLDSIPLGFQFLLEVVEVFNEVRSYMDVRNWWQGWVESEVKAIVGKESALMSGFVIKVVISKFCKE